MVPTTNLEKFAPWFCKETNSIVESGWGIQTQLHYDQGNEMYYYSVSGSHSRKLLA